MKKLSALLLISLLFGFLAGCRSPTAGLAGLNATLVRLEQSGTGEVQAVVRFINPNVYGYAIDHSEHKVSVAGVVLGTIKFTKPFGVPTQMAVEQTAVLPLAGGAALPTAGSVEARLDSVIVIRTYGDDTQTWKNTATGPAEIVVK